MSLIRLNSQPTARQLKVFGAAWLVFFGGLAVTLWFRGSERPAGVIGLLAMGVPLAGLVWPRGLRLVYVGLSYATFPIGFVVSHLVLAALYFLVITPIGFALKLFRYDPLARTAAPAGRSYWRARGEPRSAASYLRQT